MDSFISPLIVFIFMIVNLFIFYKNNNFHEKINNLNEKNEKLQEQNNDLSTLNSEYERFLRGVTQVLEEDIDFLKGTLVQKLSLDIPEVAELHRGLTRFKDDIEKIRAIMNEVENTRNE